MIYQFYVLKAKFQKHDFFLAIILKHHNDKQLWLIHFSLIQHSFMKD